jgi:hypothetical protein
VSKKSAARIFRGRITGITTKPGEDIIIFLPEYFFKILNSSKLSFFCTFKNEYKMEEYLSLIDNPTIRRTFSQYRVSIIINCKLSEEDTKTFLVNNVSANFAALVKWKTNTI